MNAPFVEIRPDVAIYAAFRRLNYKPWFALAEFVDNALQSFLVSREALDAAQGKKAVLKIRIDISEERIEIRDNAAGIALNDFPRAFLPASPPPNTSGLSEFGLGMKAAACWFASRWSVQTSALGEPTARTITYDIPDITRNHLQHLPVQESAAAPNEHYTVLTLERLNVRPRLRTIGKIKSHLSSIYRMFLQDGTLELRVDDELLSFEQSEFLQAPRFDSPTGAIQTWRKEFSLVLDESHRIWGWAAILARASVTNAGFSVFRRRRLIEGSHGESYRPELLFRKSNSYTYQRLVGELNVDGFSVSHTKDGIQWADWEDDLLNWLRTELDAEPLPLLRQSENYRARSSPRSPQGLARAADDTEILLAQRVPPLLDAQLRDHADESALPNDLIAMRSEARRETVLSLRHSQQQWRVLIEIVSEESIYEWLDIGQHEPRDGEHSLHIRVNVAHPFLVRFCSPDGAELTAFLRLAAGLAVAEVTARAAGVRQAGTIRRNLNQLLREALSEPIQIRSTADLDPTTG